MAPHRTARPRIPALTDSLARRSGVLGGVALAVLLALPACTASFSGPASMAPVLDAPRATLTIQNVGPYRARILAVRAGGVALPIASIGAGETRTLVLDGMVTDLGPVSFIAHIPSARDEVLTGEVLLRPGDHVEWRLERVGIGGRSPVPLRVERG
jgi:hypothetical protein